MTNRSGDNDLTHLGSHLAKIVSSVSPSDSIPPRSQTSSATTGSQNREPLGQSLTGQQLGEIGVGVTQLKKALALCEPAEVDRSLQALLPPSLARRLKPLNREFIDPVYGYDYEFVGYELIDGDISESDKAAARLLVDEVCRPSEPTVIFKELARLRVLTKARAESSYDIESMASIYADEMASYPQDCIVWACRKWARMEKWWPSWSELKELLDRAAKKRFALERVLR